MRELSKRYLDFNIQLESSLGYLTDANRARLGVSDDQYNHLLALLQQWSPAYQAYVNPDTHTPAAIAEVERVYKEFDPVIRGLQQQLKNDRSIVLMAEDYAKLYIHRDKQTRTRVSLPQQAPEIVLLATNHLENEFEVKQPDSENIGHLALPAGFKLYRKIAVVNPGDPAPSEQDYRPIDNVGRAKFKLTFAPADEGKIGYIICSYFNRRGEHGPESPPLRFYII